MKLSILHSWNPHIHEVQWKKRTENSARLDTPTHHSFRGCKELILLLAACDGSRECRADHCWCFWYIGPATCFWTISAVSGFWSASWLLGRLCNLFSVSLVTSATTAASETYPLSPSEAIICAVDLRSASISNVNWQHGHAYSIQCLAAEISSLVCKSIFCLTLSVCPRSKLAPTLWCDSMKRYDLAAADGSRNETYTRAASSATILWNSWCLNSLYLAVALSPFGVPLVGVCQKLVVFLKQGKKVGGQRHCQNIYTYLSSFFFDMSGKQSARDDKQCYRTVVSALGHHWTAVSVCLLTVGESFAIWELSLRC